MTELAERLKERYFGSDEHPYRAFERKVDSLIGPNDTLLDAGCGRTAPVLSKYRGKAKRLIGVEVVEFPSPLDGIELLNCDLARMPLADRSVDVVMSRSVMEHIVDPASVYAEIARVLRPGGSFVFLTGNFWDYAAVITNLIPNRFHPWIVARTQGRAEIDVFPTAYKTNTRASVDKWSRGAGFEVISYDYLGQYPAYFMFNGLLFLIATGYEKVISRFDALRFLRGWILVVLNKRA
jgi:SAM-dependent methyltransferase